MAGELNCNDVPMVIFPVLVMDSAALASYAEREKKCQGRIRNLTRSITVAHVRVMPRSQGPLMNAPAMARTSGGVKAMSKAWGMALAPCITFRIVWWRASTVMMEAAATRTAGSSMICVAPMYAATPVISTTRATGVMAETLVSTLEKSNSQEIGVTSNELRSDCSTMKRSENEYESGS